MLKIGQFTDTFLPIVDGVGRVVQAYSETLCKMGHQVTVVAPMYDTGFQGGFPFQLVEYVASSVPGMKQYKVGEAVLDAHYRHRIRMIELDVIHAHSPFTAGSEALRLAAVRKLPLVATFHSKYYDAVLEFTKSRAIARMVTNQIVKLFENCDEVWACSEETGETLRSYGYTKPYFVMPNGTDVSAPADAEVLKERAAERFSLPRGKHILLFVGQMIWYKNQQLILDTMRLLCDRGDDWFLVMAGSGKDEQEMARYAARLQLADRVLFTGLIRDRDLLRGVYLNADLLFFPSVFDNAPLVLREAAVLGVPTLAAEGSNAAGAIRKDFSGYTAEAAPEAMAAEIRRIFRETDVRQTGRNAQETIPLAWEKLVPMVLDRYRTVIEKYRKMK